MTTYLLDSNVFIQAKNLHYGLDFCPAFWEWLVRSNAAGRVLSIDRIADELNAGNDELSDWTRRNKNLFRKLNPNIAEQLKAVSSWATDKKQGYEQGAINTFLQAADYYLIAYALAEGHVVITHEILSNSTRRIKIPNVCAGLDLTFMTPFEMLRRERARFVLGPNQGLSFRTESA